MTKKEVLELLKELVSTASISHSDPDDWSGLSTVYYVDQEQFLKNIEAALENIVKEKASAKAKVK
jgi:hypothetical protein